MAAHLVAGERLRHFRVSQLRSELCRVDGSLCEMAYDDTRSCVMVACDVLEESPSRAMVMVVRAPTLTGESCNGSLSSDPGFDIYWTSSLLFDIPFGNPNIHTLTRYYNNRVLLPVSLRYLSG